MTLAPNWMGGMASPQFVRQADAPAGAALLDQHGLQFLAQPGILFLARAFALASGVVTTARHAQQGAEHRDPMLRCQLLNVRAAIVHGRERMPKDF